MPADLIDIGPNLVHDSFDADRTQVVARAQAIGVTQMVITGSDVASAQAAQRLSQAYPGQLFATAGLHPHHAADFDAATLATFRALANAPGVVALGEMGLDFFRDVAPRKAQELAFRQQLDLAAELHMPVFLHQRDSHERFLPILREYRERLPAAVAHCFTGTAKELDAYLELDLHIGITGWICDERRGRHLLDCVDRIPGNRLMIETDSPYLMPRTIRPKPKTRRNEPANLPWVLETLASARGQDPSELAAITTATARSFFGLPNHAPATGAQTGSTA